MRSDSDLRCSEVPKLAALKEDGQHDLVPPNFDEIGQMISYPLQAAGKAFEMNEKGERLSQVLQQAAVR